jgi:hypothetical protein
MIKIFIMVMFIAFHSNHEFLKEHTAVSTGSYLFKDTSGANLNIRSKLIDNKVYLEWSMNENEFADQFQVEKSEDGKNFIMVGLVFSNDKPGTGLYQFYEKVNSLKQFYRVKLINKNQQTEYSNVIRVTPFKSHQLN